MSDISINQLLTQMRAMQEMAQGQSVTVIPKLSGETERADFSALLQKSIDTVNDIQQASGKLTNAFETGDPDVSLPEVMIALQKASISFQAISQVRNRLVSAYQDVMNMPV